MRTISNEEIQLVGGSGFFDDIWDSVSNFFGWNDIQSVEIVGQRMTQSEKNAYDLTENLNAVREAVPSGCTASATMTLPAQSYTSTATVSVTPGVTSQLTNTSPTIVISTTCN